MIRSQKGLERSVKDIRKVKQSVQKYKDIITEKTEPLKQKIKKIKDSYDLELTKLSDQEQLHREEIKEYIEQNEYGKVPGLSIRSLLHCRVSDRQALISWVIKNELFQYITINEKAVLDHQKKNPDKDIPGFDPYLTDTIVIKEA
jgi:hypothetical protein